VLTAGFLSRYVVRLIDQPVARRFQRQSIAQTVLRTVRLAVTLSGVAVGLSILGFQVGDLVLSVTVFSVVAGVVLAPLVGSVMNGLFILADQPYEIGDLIELDNGNRGFVDDITVRYTKIFTLENTFLVIPNDVIRDQLVTNFSAEDERTRRSLLVIITYESDITHAQQLIRRAAAEVENVIEGGPDIRIGTARYPASPTVLIHDFGDDGIVLKLRYWVERPYQVEAVDASVRETILRMVDKSEKPIEFAYPHRQILFDDAQEWTPSESL